MASADPRATYQARLELRSAALARLDGRDARLGQARLWTFLLAVALANLAGRGDLAWSWLAVPGAGFFALVIVHDRLIRERARVGQAVAHYREGLDRLDDRWAGKGVVTLEHVDPDHSFAADFDVFGVGSLFDLLCRARTHGGERTLARWLTDKFGGVGPEPGIAGRIAARQASVRALRDRIDLREDLAVLGGAVRVGVRPGSLTEWGTSPATPPGLLRVWAIAGVITPLCAIAGVVAWAAGYGPLGLLVVAAGQGLVQRRSGEALAQIAGPLDRSAFELGVLAELIQRVEREPVDDPKLSDSTRRLAGAALAIARLRRLVGLQEAPRNALFAPIAFLLAWSPSAARAIERWRAQHGASIGDWIAALAEWEAVSSLAGHAFEHPDDPFPTIVEAGPVLRGDQLGHPLLAVATCVSNSVSLAGMGADAPSAYVISGSNMSGKSTFLRTVGTNVVLALAGAPIRGVSLELSPLRIGATLRIQDSLHEGHSRFWAELVRLRTISELADRGPVLFLLDEIFHGTNSHDRGIGAEGLLRSLIDRGAIGMLTTHDLALAKAAEALAPRAINMHFEDELREGELIFDYRMRPGVVERSNALALMRAVGLKV